MVHFDISEIKGKTINEGQYSRLVKLIASRYSRVKRDKFTVGISIIEPGKVHEDHSHEFNQEIIIAIKGSGTAVVGGVGIDVAPGTVIDLEKNEPHSFINTGAEDLELLWIYDPPGDEAQFLG